MMQNDLEGRKPDRNQAKGFNGLFFQLGASNLVGLDFRTELELRLESVVVNSISPSHIQFQFPAYAPFNGSSGKAPAYSLEVLSERPAIPDSQFPISPDLSVTRQLIQQCNGWISFQEQDALELDHMNRIHLFNQWLVSVVRVLNPFSTYCFGADEYYSTPEILDALGGDAPHILQGIVALKNSADGEETAVHTHGMASLGLPEFRVLQKEGLSEEEMADLLWNYAYSTYQNGDIWRTGSPIMGPMEGIRWYCARSRSPLMGNPIMVTAQSIQ